MAYGGPINQSTKPINQPVKGNLEPYKESLKYYKMVNCSIARQVNVCLLGSPQY